MNPMEIIALVISIMVLLKTITFLFNPKWLSKLLEKMYSYTKVLTIFVSIVILALGTYLLMYMGAVMLIVAALFGMMTIALVLVMYPKLYLKFGRDILNDKKKLIPVFLVWGILAVLTLWKLFG